MEGKRLSKLEHRLVAKWDEKEGVIADVTPRRTNADVYYLFNNVFTDQVIDELRRRGYDLSTLYFRIDKTTEAVDAYEAARAPHERADG